MKISTPEKQDIEFKEAWHDKYLEWVCGFANAKGGKIYIGVDDNQEIVGLKNSKKLLEDIPNKVKSLLGIIPEVNLHSQNGLDYIEIIVHPYSNAISYKGHYFYRCGSVKTEYTGVALTEFLLKKMGQTWDETIEQRASIDDIDDVTLDIYINEVKASGRFFDLSNLNKLEILEKLDLVENNQLKKAALVLFGKKPTKFYTGNVLKIAKFSKSGSTIIHQEYIDKNLILTQKEALEILRNKFLRFDIRIEGMTRIETLEYPEEALRETIINALVHRSYIESGTILIRLTGEDSLSIWNPGRLHPEISIEMLKTTHPSKPNNKLIAQACFRAGLIESWGRGTTKIIELSKEANLQPIEIKEYAGGVQVDFLKSSQATDQATDQAWLSLLKEINKKELNRSEMMKFLQLSHRPNFNERFVKPMLEEKLIEMTIPDKPSSPKQKYRITEKGKRLI